MNIISNNYLNNKNNHNNLNFHNNPTSQNIFSHPLHSNKTNNQKTLLNKKTLYTINTKYNKYFILNNPNNNINNNDFNKYIQKGKRIIYIKNNRIKKGKISRILTNNIIELCRGKKTWFIYLHKYIILVEKDNSLRSMLEDIVNNRLEISFYKD